MKMVLPNTDQVYPLFASLCDRRRKGRERGIPCGTSALLNLSNHVTKWHQCLAFDLFSKILFLKKSKESPSWLSKEGDVVLF